MDGKHTVILVGHGAVPSDAPAALVAERKSLESARRLHGERVISSREAALDRTIRNWPRSAANDPYFAGLHALADRLARRVGGRHLIVAFNEFCAPSIEEAIAAAVEGGARRIDVLTTMFTPGGAHAERDIPSIVAEARQLYSGVDIRYAWPFDLDRAADFLAEHLADVDDAPEQDVLQPFEPSGAR